MKKKIITFITAFCLVMTMIPIYSMEANAATVSIRHIWPVSDKYKVDRNGGEWNDWEFHNQHGHYGIDIPAPNGTPVYASAAGKVVVSAYNGSGYGHYILIQHSDGTYSLYAHMSKRYVKKGVSVKQAQKIGAVGNTGNSYGSHLHYGIYLAKKYFDNEVGYRPNVGTVNPERYLEKWLKLKAKNNAATGKPIIEWCRYPGATKYVIYNKRGKNANWTRIASTTGQTITNTSAIPSYYYYYKVSAYNGSKLLRSSTVNRSCDLAKPNFYSISKDSKNRVVLKFKGVKYANCYKVYRATSASGSYSYLFKATVKMDKGGESHIFYTTSGTKGKKYYYKIRAVNTNNSGADSALTGYRYIVR